MKNIWILTRTNLKRNKLAVILAVAGAVLLCMMLTMLGDMIADRKEADIPIGIIDYDKSILSQDFKNYLSNDLHYKLIGNLNFDQLSTELIDKNLSVIIEIPKDFYARFSIGKHENITVTSLNDYENAAYVKIYINNYLNSIGLLAKGAEGNSGTFDRLLSEYQKNGMKITRSAALMLDKNSYSNQQGFINSIGFFLMFIFGISILISYMILDDRLAGVYKRIQASPVQALQYIAGTGITGLFLCLLQIAIYIGYIVLCNIKTGIPVHHLILLLSLFSVFTVCFSIAIAVILISKKAIITISFGFATVGCILGGSFFPIDMAPKTMQNLARILPQYWFMDALRKLQSDIGSNIYPNVTILALFALLCLLIGAVSFAQNNKSC